MNAIILIRTADDPNDARSRALLLQSDMAMALTENKECFHIIKHKFGMLRRDLPISKLPEAVMECLETS